MLDALQTLLENNVISQELKEDVEKAWHNKLAESTQLLREEFAEKYEHDKANMFEAVNNLVTDQMKHEVGEFIKEQHALAEMKVKYAKQMNKSANTLKEFVTRQLAEEVREIHEDSKQLANKFGTLEQFVLEALAQEITEFQHDKQEVAATKVKLVREGKEALAKVKQEFIRRASGLVENVVSTTLTKELTALKEDINYARKNDFGRQLFEAFAHEYQHSHLNTKSETSKLLKVIEEKDLAIQEAAQAVVKAEKLLESRQHKISLLQESATRKDVMTELLAPLNSEQKSIMRDLMESVATDKLSSSFDKYLPAVIAGDNNKPAKKKLLAESKEFTGDKSPNTKTTPSTDANQIVDIRRLAGL
jgi:hypothetical protein